jgi:S-formylglutathione hydrolase FrmB
MQKVFHRAERLAGPAFASARRKTAKWLGAVGLTLCFAVSAIAVLWTPGSVATAPPRNAARAECSSVPSRILGRTVSYCILLPPTYDANSARRYPVLYELHGLSDDERMLLRPGVFNLMEGMWERKQLGEFLIVTPAGDSSFYVNSHDGQRYEDFLLREFLPDIERRYRVQPGRDSRAVAGISMGGYGALHLAFAHPDLFGSVSAESPALIETLQPTGARAQTAALRGLGDVFGKPVDRAFWNHDNPLTLARTADLDRLKIYFDCGAKDDYGFNLGAQTLDEELAARSIPHEFHLYPGRHNWDYFASHLSASMEFHSHAFGAQESTATSASPSLAGIAPRL